MNDLGLKHRSPDGKIRPCYARLGNCRFTQIGPNGREFNTSQFKEIISKEPDIRKDLKPIVERTKGKLIGLEFSTKTSRSTAEKIIVREKANSLDEMWDIVRYTSLLKTKDYVKSYKETLKELESKG